MEITTRTDLFLANAPLHGISRIAYSNNVSVNPGAWILVTQSLTADEAQRINQPALSDGAQPLTPMECVVKPGAFAGQRRRAPVFACAPYYSDEALTQELHWLPPTLCQLQLPNEDNGESPGTFSKIGEFFVTGLLEFTRS